MTVLLLQQLKNEKDLDWRFQLLPRPWEQFITEFETAEKHDIASISIPQTTDGPSLFPEMYASVFHGQIVEVSVNLNPGLYHTSFASLCVVCG